MPIFKNLFSKRKRKKKKKNKKMEFSKKWLITCVVISIFYTTLSYIFAWFDKNSLESLAIEIIEVLWGTTGISFVGYALQNCCRAYTSSKFGIPNGQSTEQTGSNENISRNMKEDDYQ